MSSTLESETPLTLARWQRELASAIRDPAELCRLLDLPADFCAEAAAAAGQFPLFVPRPFLARFRRGDPSDPLLRQVLPLAAETATAAGFTPDPVGDLGATAAPGLLHKYRGRALMVTTGACPVHCRYCFRRQYPYQTSPRAWADWQPAIEQIEADESISEIIISGGDPLTLPDRLLARLAERLASIPHLRRLRIHSRMPIMIPSRINDELLQWLTGTRLTPIMVIHANHPAEFDAAVESALARLLDAGVPILNQAVLLSGVNDDTETLVALSERLINLRVTPYYLHQLDKVAGAAHFEVAVDRGREIVAEMRKRLPGYAVPRYVREIAGEEHKIELT